MELTALDEFVEMNEIAAAVAINPTDIDSELIRMASLYSRFGVLAAKARSQRDLAKTGLELIEAKLDKALRDKFAGSGEKVTENKIRSELVLQPAYAKAVEELNEANSIMSVAETTLSSLEMKRDMLVQLNKNAIQEWSYSTANVAMQKEAVDAAIRGMKTSPSI